MVLSAAVTVGALVGGLWARSAVAQSYGIDLRNTLMPASGGMAGTSVAAPQDMLSAINANPASLSQYRGTHFTFGGAFVEPTVRMTQTRALPALGVEPYSAVSTTPAAIAPNIGASYEVPGMPLPTTFGIALIGAAGGAANFLAEPASNGTSSSLDILQFAPAVSLELTDDLSVGGTLFLGECMLSGPFVGVSAMNSAYALRCDLGVNYRLRDTTRIGGYYQSTQAFRLQDHLRPFGGSQVYDTNVGLPQQVGIGISDESLLDGRLLLAADALYFDWDSAAMLNAFFNAQWALQAGMQYQVNDRLKARLGYSYAGNPVGNADAPRVGGVPVPGGRGCC